MIEPTKRISACLNALAGEGRKALVCYIVCGDPDLDSTLAAMHRLVEAGADIIELGVPFSDPMAEGPVIQKAHERALAAGASLHKTLSLVAEFRKNDTRTPVILMGYANPVERMGYETFAAKASEVGVDGLLTVDLPPEEVADLDACLQARGLDNIFLIAPTTSDARIRAICGAARGFVYYVSFKGVTGADRLDADSVASSVQRIREHAQCPVMVGFGIKDAASAKAVAIHADGIVVGSALVSAMAASAQGGDGLDQLQALVKSMRLALDE